MTNSLDPRFPQKWRRRHTVIIKPLQIWLLVIFSLAVGTASAQSFRVQCPSSTITHPDPLNTGVNNSEPAYTGPTTFTTDPTGQYLKPSGNVNGAIKCQQISGGDGYATMGDGTQTYMFSFGPLSGLADIANGLPGTQPPSTFNISALGLQPGDPATTDGIVANTWPSFPLPTGPFNYNGAVGLANNVPYVDSIFDIS